MNDDPLEDLYVEKSVINKERLAEVLSGIFGIDRDTGDAVIRSGYSDLSQSQKVFAYLLYRRAAFELGQLAEENLGLSGTALSDATGVPKGTVEWTCSDSSFIENDQSIG